MPVGVSAGYWTVIVLLNWLQDGTEPLWGFTIPVALLMVASFYLLTQESRKDG